MALTGGFLLNSVKIATGRSAVSSIVPSSEMLRLYAHSLVSGAGLDKSSAPLERSGLPGRLLSSKDSSSCSYATKCPASAFRGLNGPEVQNIFNNEATSFSNGLILSHWKASSRLCSMTRGMKQRSQIRCQIADKEDPVVSTEWLAKRLTDVCLLDVRGHVESYLVEEGVEKSDYKTDYDEYLEGHIPGAIFFSWVRDGVDPQASVPVQLMTDTNDFAPVMEAKGVSTEKPVVIYDKGDGLLAPRVWWALVLHGHPCVRILDGGLKKWVDEGRSLELYEPCTLKDLEIQVGPAQQVYSDYTPKKLYPSLVASWEDLLSLVSKVHAEPTTSEKDVAEKVAIVDARDNAQYSGLIRRSKYAGRVPGAINIPRRSLLEPGGTFKSVEMQLQVFKDAGLDPKNTTNLIAYCNGGVASCTVLLAWHRVQGNGTWANYDGSWNEWGSRDDLPVEK